MRHMHAMTHWKADIVDLRNHAQAVSLSSVAQMSARSAACCLSGVFGLVASQFGLDAAQHACAAIVRCDAGLTTLPRGEDGAVAQPVAMIATVARGVLALAGRENMRAALSFWASESDAAEWQRIASV